MSKLWQSFLEQVRIIGNHSGCHQLPERSFFINGKQFPVCARCTGVTVGQLGAVIIFILTKKSNYKAALCLLGIMGIDWGLQAVKIRKSTNPRRLITGICGGYGIITLYLSIGRSMIRLFRNLHRL